MQENPSQEADENEGNDELFEHFSITATKGQEPLRIDKFLMNFKVNATRNKIQNAAKAGNIMVNNQVVKANYKVKPFDEVSVVLSYPPKENVLLSENIPLDIVYEDDDLLVVNKPAGMVVHPGHGNHSGTLINALQYHFEQQPNYDADLKRVGLVHRIDKDTSGLLVIAKNELTMNHLAKQFFQKTTKRIYSALVWGNVAEEEGTISGYINRNYKNRLQMQLFSEEEEGKIAITHYKVLERFRYVTLVECQLETGRTHQIRASFKHIGHTLFNDERYGGNKVLKGTTFTKYKQFVENCFSLMPRQALHARTLGFIHPTTKKMMEFDSAIPTDMQNCIEKWEKYTQFI